MDELVGPCADEVAPAGDLPVRDRAGNWTYGFAVVVDDARQRIGRVVRGRDLAAATPAQIRLARLLGRERPPTFAHHRLVRRPDGRKLSKGDGDTSVRDLRAAGRSAAEIIGAAAAAIGLLDAVRPIEAGEAGELLAAAGR
jgi:glutamyl/glutaminyl-tRNA synthetase